MDKNTIEKPERNKVKIFSLLPGKTNITLFCEKTCENSKIFFVGNEWNVYLKNILWEVPVQCKKTLKKSQKKS